MFLALVRSVSIATILSILVLMLVISIYVRRSLQPLRQMSQLAGTISADDLVRLIYSSSAPQRSQRISPNLQHDVRLSAAWEQQRQLVSDVS